MADWENLAKKLEAVTVLETYENGSQLVQNAHPDGFLAAAVIREQAARIAALEAAFRVNMLRCFPDKTHEEIDAEIRRCAGGNDD